MVKIRVTVTVVPEDVYLAAQDERLAPAARPAHARRLMVPCESPETWTIGQFTNKIKDAYKKTYRGEDLGTVKYIKDEDDADLHTDLSVYDALVNAGDEARDLSDQRTKMTIIQEQGLPLRGGSVIPDLSAPEYRVPWISLPPVYVSSQGQSSGRKRSRDTAFEGDNSFAQLLRSRPDQSSSLVAVSVENPEHATLESVERDTPNDDDDDQILRRSRNIPVAQPQDLQLPKSDETANSLSPDHPDTGLTTSARPTKHDLNLSRRSYDRTPNQTSHKHATIRPSRSVSSSQRDAASAEALILETTENDNNKSARLQNQSHLQPWQTRPNPPITPPSDTSPAGMKGRFTQPAPKPVASALGSGSASKKFKSVVPQGVFFESQSSIEDSQMSPRSKKKRTPYVEMGAAVTEKRSNPTQPTPNAGKIQNSSSGTAVLHDDYTPIVARKHASNEPAYSFTEAVSFRDDIADYQGRSHKRTTHPEFGYEVAAHYRLTEEGSADRAVANSQRKHESTPGILSKIGGPQLHYGRPAFSDAESHSPSQKGRVSADPMDQDFHKENIHSLDPMPSDVPEMQYTAPGNEVNLSTKVLQRPDEPFSPVEISRKKDEMPRDHRKKDLPTVNILNNGTSIAGTASKVGEEMRQSPETSDKRPIGPLNNSNLATKSPRGRRKKKSRIDASISQLGNKRVPATLEKEKSVPSKRSVGDQDSVASDEHSPNYRQPRSEEHTPTSRGSADDQLLESLRACTQEKLPAGQAEPTLGADTSFKIVPAVHLHDNPVRLRVYEGVVESFRDDTALVSIKGVKNEPFGLLHRNGLEKQSSSGHISRFLSVQEVINVKVTSIKDGEIRLSMRGVDQSEGEYKGALTDGQLLNREDSEQLDAGPLDTSKNLQASSKKQGNPKKARLNDRPLSHATESHQDPSKQPDGGLEIVKTIERIKTPETEAPLEPHFGLGFTDTPRKRRMKSHGADEAELSTVQTSAPANMGLDQACLTLKNTSPANGDRSRLGEPQRSSASKNGVKLNLSTKPKKLPAKSRLETDIGQKQPKLSDSAASSVAYKKQQETYPSNKSNISKNFVEQNLGDDSSLLPGSPKSKTNMDPEEDIYLPPGMSIEKYLAQQQANVEFIARRDAIATHKPSAASLSETKNIQAIRSRGKPTVKKQKERLADQRHLSAAFETPLTEHNLHKKTPNHELLLVDHNYDDTRKKSPNRSEKHQSSKLDDKIVQQDNNKSKLSTESTNNAKNQEIELVSTTVDSLHSHATVTPMLSRSTALATVGALYTTPPTKTAKQASKPLAKATNLKPQQAKTLNVKSEETKSQLNSKALSMAELKARKAAAKRPTKTPSSSFSLYSSIPSASTPPTILTLDSDTDDSESDSQSDSSSDDKYKRKSSVTERKRASQKPISRPDPTIRDRSVSVDTDEGSSSYST